MLRLVSGWVLLWVTQSSPFEFTSKMLPRVLFFWEGIMCVGGFECWACPSCLIRALGAHGLPRSLFKNFTPPPSLFKFIWNATP